MIHLYEGNSLSNLRYFAIQGSIITALYLCENLQCELITYRKIIACKILLIYGTY